VASMQEEFWVLGWCKWWASDWYWSSQWTSIWARHCTAWSDGI